MMRRLVNAPIPGESLTGKLGSANWENPPQFSTPEEALEYIWQKITKPKNVAKMSIVLETGVPVEAMARTIVFNGFVDGRWTPDVGLLIAPIVFNMVYVIAKKSNTRNIILRNQLQDDFINNFIPSEDDVRIPQEFQEMAEEEDVSLRSLL